MQALLRSAGLLVRAGAGAGAGAGSALAAAGPSSAAAAWGALAGAGATAAAAAALQPALPSAVAARRGYIRVPVVRGQISSALKDVSRIMRADGMQAQLWDAQVFTRPALRRVKEAKASAARAAGRKFRWSMGWVARRRERGF